MRDDGRVLEKRRLRPAVAVREQLAEFIHRVDRIEADHAGVGAYPGTRVDAARPVLKVAALERLELLALDSRLCDDFLQRDMVAFAVPPKACDEVFLRGHLRLHVDPGTPAITAPV